MRILYRDRWLVAVHKPPGLLMHRTAQSRDRHFLLQEVRNQLGARVYPLHRLDRATSGVVLFALDAESAAALAADFRERKVTKVYHGVARGFTAAEGWVRHPLRGDAGAPPKAASTYYRRLATVELPIPVGRYASARYSLVEVQPHSGRRHQIRRHFAHLSHHLIGDTAYGKGEHNRLFRHRFDVHRLLLIAVALRFVHPVSGAPVTVTTCYDAELVSLFRRLGWPVHPQGRACAGAAGA